MYGCVKFNKTDQYRKLFFFKYIMMHQVHTSVDNFSSNFKLLNYILSYFIMFYFIQQF